MTSKTTIADSFKRKLYPYLIDLAIDYITLKESEKNISDVHEYNLCVDEFVEVARNILKYGK